MIQYTKILLYTDVAFGTSIDAAALQTALDAAADESYAVVGINDHWIILAREFDQGQPA